MKSRRQFLQNTLGVLGLVSLSRLPFALGEEERRRAKPSAGGDTKESFVDPNDPTAKALNYVEKHADLKKAELKVDRMGVKFDNQQCKACQFYTAVPGKNGGHCSVLQNKLVHAEGWCSSWSKKA